MEPDIISVKCPTCDRIWDLLYNEKEGVPPPEVECSICVKDKNRELNSKAGHASNAIDMGIGDH